MHAPRVLVRASRHIYGFVLLVVPSREKATCLSVRLCELVAMYCGSWWGTVILGEWHCAS